MAELPKATLLYFPGPDGWPATEAAPSSARGSTVVLAPGADRHATVVSAPPPPRKTTVLVYDTQMLAAMASHEAIAPDTVLGDRHQLVRRIGQGGMGEVWEARDLLIRRSVAIKILRYADGDEAAARFVREAQTVGKIAHPNVIGIFDFGRTRAGLPYYVMEMLRGETLASRLSRGAMTWDTAGPIAMQVIDALAATHAVGVVHRDVKPDNVFLVARGDRRDLVKLLDFGISKVIAPSPASLALTHAGVVFGTPRYMSPEQLRGDPVDARTDVYAVGCLLYAMLTGGPPFEGKSVESIVAGHLFDDPPRFADAAGFLEIPPRLEAVVRRCLAKDPAARFRDMAELTAALGERARVEPRRTSTSVKVGVAALVIAAAGVGAWRLVPRDATPVESTSESPSQPSPSPSPSPPTPVAPPKVAPPTPVAPPQVATPTPVAPPVAPTQVATPTIDVPIERAPEPTAHAGDTSPTPRASTSRRPRTGASEPSPVAAQPEAKPDVFEPPRPRREPDPPREDILDPFGPVE